MSTLSLEVDNVGLVIGALLVAALFCSALVLCACLAIDHYESRGRAERDHQGI